MIAPGYEPDHGGVETHVRMLCLGLHALGHEVEVWAPARGTRLMRTEIRDGIRVRRFPSTSSHRFPMSPWLWAYARRARGMDILHAHSYHATAAVGLITSRAPAARVLTPHYHGSGGHSALAAVAHVPYKVVGARLFAAADAIVAVTEAEAGLIGQNYPDTTSRISVVHNAADVSAIHAAAPRRTKVPVLLVSGRLEDYKRVDAVIDAFSRSDVDARLVITGDGPARERLEGTVQRSRRRDAISMLGRVPETELREWQRTAVATISMSEHEAFGIVAVEAVAAGGWAVLSDIPAHREVADLLRTEQDPDVVQVVPRGDEAALIAAIRAVVARGGPGTPRPGRSWDEAVAEHDELYRSILATGRDRPGTDAAHS